MLKIQGVTCLMLFLVGLGIVTCFIQASSNSNSSIQPFIENISFS